MGDIWRGALIDGLAPIPPFRGGPFEASPRGQVYSPATLFAAGEEGAWYDPSDLDTLWQDAAGTTPAIVDGPVGRMDDKSGRGNHLTQTIAAARPTLRQVGAVYYLEFDGVDDHLVRSGPSFNLWDAGSFTLSLALQGGPPAADRYLVAQGSSASANPVLGPVRSGPTTATSNVPTARSDSNNQNLSLTGETQALVNAHTGDKVLTVAESGSTYRQYLDHGSAVETAYTRAGPFTLDRLSLGALVRSSAALYWAGRFYGMVIRSGAELAAPDRANLVDYLAGLQDRPL